MQLKSRPLNSQECPPYDCKPKRSECWRENTDDDFRVDIAIMFIEKVLAHNLQAHQSCLEKADLR